MLALRTLFSITSPDADPYRLLRFTVYMEILLLLISVAAAGWFNNRDPCCEYLMENLDAALILCEKVAMNLD